MMLAYVIRPTERGPYRWCNEKGIGGFKKRPISVVDIVEGRKTNYEDRQEFCDKFASGLERRLLEFSIANIDLQNGSELDVEFINHLLGNEIRIGNVDRKSLPYKGKYLKFRNKAITTLGPWMDDLRSKQMEILGINETPKWLAQLEILERQMFPGESEISEENLLEAWEEDE